MARRGYKRCQICGYHESEVGSISHRGRCVTCGPVRQLEATYDMVTHSGPYFDKWRANLAASVGAVFTGGS